jgi:hypothetical protein
MQNSLSRVLVICVGTLVAVGCGQSVNTPSSPSAVVSTDPQASSAVSRITAAAKAGMIDVCHKVGGGFTLLTINDTAWPAHEAHGDGSPSGAVPGTNLFFDSACAIAAPAASISATPNPMAFGSIAIGAVSGERTITVTNTGGTTSFLGGVTITGDANDFVVVRNTCSPQSVGSFEPAETCEVGIRFVPSAEGARNATFLINLDGGPTASVALTGTGV